MGFISKKSKSIEISLFFFIFSVGCVVTFIILDFLFFTYNTKSKLLDTAIETSIQKEQQFVDSILTTNELLNAINESNSFNLYLDSKNTDDVNDLFLLLIKHDKNIMQLRYLDKNGFEKVRVDRNKYNEEPFIVRNENLQNKSNRYYFKESILKDSKVWYSNLDLNIEHGKVEKPYKPTLRAMLPIKKNGNFNGILIVNYHMQSILERISKSPSYDMILFNDEGYPLIHYNKKKNWGYYQDKKVSVKEDLTKYYDEILNSTNSFKNGDFIVKKIDFDLPQKLFIYLKLNDRYLNNLLTDRYLHYFSVSLIIVLLSILMSTIFSSYLRKIFLVLKDSKTLNNMLNKKVEEQTKEINDSRKQLNDIITTINDFIWEVDKYGKYTYLSPQVETILGYKPKELLGKTPFEIMPKVEKKKIKKEFFHILKSNQPINQLKNKNIHKNGYIVYLETSGNPVFNDKGEFVGYRGSDRDITQKVNAQKIINDNYKKIEELNESLAFQVDEEVKKNKQKDMQLFAQSKLAAMGDMIANIAHQWRQPLSTISTLASGVKIKQELGVNDKEDLLKDMDAIVDKTLHLSKTIDTFMNFVKEKKELEEVCLKNVVKKAISIVESSLHNKFIELNINYDKKEDFRISTVSAELKEVLINILNNAKDALEQNDIANKKIGLNIEKKDDKFVINIEDNGGGISNKIIDRIFEPYFTTKHAAQGTGLGLHMSYRIVTESLKGNIFAKNGKEGAIFTIELPIIL